MEGAATTTAAGIAVSVATVSAALLLVLTSVADEFNVQCDSEAARQTNDVT